MTTITVDMTCLKNPDTSVLSNEEIVSLFKEFKLEHNEEARKKIVVSNIKLILSSVQKFKNRGENLNDLFQIGCIGLMKAIDKFNLEKGCKFSTYAVWMIEGEIKRYLRDSSLVRVNRSSKYMLYKINKIKDQFITENCKEPTNKEISEIMGVKEKEISSALLSLQPVVSLYEPIESDNEKTMLLDKIGDSSISEELTVNNVALNEAINRLNEKEKKVISMRYFLDKTQAEIASEFGVSQAQISRLEKNAMNAMKKYLRA